MSDDLLRRVKDLESRVADLETIEYSKIFYERLTHTTGTAWSTATSRDSGDDGTIDLSATFGTPANITAVILRIDINDGDGSAPVALVSIGDGTTNRQFFADPAYNGEWMVYNTVHVPCDSNGDIVIAFSETVDQFVLYVEGWVI